MNAIPCWVIKSKFAPLYWGKSTGWQSLPKVYLKEGHATQAVKLHDLGDYCEVVECTLLFEPWHKVKLVEGE